MKPRVSAHEGLSTDNAFDSAAPAPVPQLSEDTVLKQDEINMESLYDMIYDNNRSKFI